MFIKHIIGYAIAFLVGIVLTLIFGKEFSSLWNLIASALVPGVLSGVVSGFIANVLFRKYDKGQQKKNEPYLNVNTDADYQIFEGKVVRTESTIKNLGELSASVTKSSTGSTGSTISMPAGTPPTGVINNPIGSTGSTGPST